MVCRGYMLGKHIHALKLPDILIVIPSFSGVCICLAFNSKKKSHFVCSAFALPPFYLRSKTVVKPFLRMGGRWELHRRIIGGTRAEYARHFLGKMKKMPFSLEKKEKNIIFASEGLFTFDIGL